MVGWFSSNILFSIVSSLLIFPIIRIIMQQGERWHWKTLKIGSLNIKYFPWVHPKQGVKEEYIGLFGIAGYSEFILAIALIPRIYRLRENKKRKYKKFPLNILFPKMLLQESNFLRPIAIFPFALNLPEDTDHQFLIDNLCQDRYWERWIVDRDKLKGLRNFKQFTSKSWSSVREEQQPYFQGEDIPKRIQNAFLLAKESQGYRKGKKIILSNPISPDKQTK